MEQLLYRGNQYNQHNKIVFKKSVQLKYRQSIYNQRRKLIPQTQHVLMYRGNKYLSKESSNKSYTTKITNKAYSLARDLINAQFNLGNDELSRKLWDEVAALKIDPHRIINLMYRCYLYEDDKSMLEADLDYFSKE